MIALHAVQHCSRGGFLAGPISHDFAVGKIHVLCGPNGVGKSTLLRHLAGLMQPTEGQIKLSGHPLQQFSMEALARRRVLLPQRHPLTFALRVEEVIALGGMPYRGNTDIQSGIERALQAFGLEDFVGRAYTHLSGGEQQRIQLARAFLQFWLAGRDEQTHYALFDEPVNGLDLVHQKKFLTLMRQSLRPNNTLILALHDLSLAAACADSAVLMQDGRILAAGEPQSVFTPERIASTFGVEAWWHEHPRSGTPVLIAGVRHDAL
jgi:iron complex transport system ATP-binding protein